MLTRSKHLYHFAWYIKVEDFSNNKFEPNKPMTRDVMSRWLANDLAHANVEYGKSIEEMANSSLTVIPIPEFLWW
ncbi:hypothetical protein ABNX05_01635 [Lysinibacillus sp. M3]|uniref:Uncharacterized protein n=1 Tax=Lysinibacillus zambalensis TaxID=3160866 RepID=A0ABV1MLD6_9BACI